MSLKDEIEHFDRVKVLPDTGETDTWDQIVFPNVIRKREIELILSQVKGVKPKRILDLGCGTGWLSKVLSTNGHHVVGIDVSSWLIKNAISSTSQNSLFLVGDCMNLPFKSGTFDAIVGIGVLHHLAIEKGLSECLRVATPGATLLLMEPNKLNLVAALGKKVVPVSIHTKGEKPFTPWRLARALRDGGWVIARMTYLFPFSFGLAYIMRRTGWRNNEKLKPICLPIEMVERLLEKVPLLNRLSSTMVIIARKAEAR